MTFEEWINEGIKLGYCSPLVCYTHDGLPLSKIEDELMWDSGEVCIPIIRLYEDRDTKMAVETHSLPAVWRKLKDD
jgi:hypothetical protein